MTKGSEPETAGAFSRLPARARYMAFMVSNSYSATFSSS